ncbi:DUF413 domain-containing protein [Gilvimarinus polysaccharolyticus]|uniref:DUF413 domain-containing protein n=1 Tax=Gilvimarinus polysaccharolyticus TaxID=863921 RepID=UPI000673ACA3|nr:DUF413 domain-containing protein [Gilvimarinus polysaccharolyticus]
MLPREHYLKQPFQGLHALHNQEALSSAQARLVKKHGTLIVALLNNDVLNPTLADMRTVKVISQKNAPTNPIEQAWLKYDALITEQKTKHRLKRSA